MEFKQLSEWIMIGEYSATRIVKGGDPNNISDRVALIDKTPRIRINKNKFCIEQKEGCTSSDSDIWLYGDKGSSEHGLDFESLSWCDQMLVLLGWS